MAKRSLKASSMTRWTGPAGRSIETADEAIRRYPFIDGSRQCAAGKLRRAPC
jgi:hypothetical protein